MMAALDARRVAMNRVHDFERRHPAIIALLRANPWIDESSPSGGNV